MADFLDDYKIRLDKMRSYDDYDMGLTRADQKQVIREQFEPGATNISSIRGFFANAARKAGKDISFVEDTEVRTNRSRLSDAAQQIYTDLVADDLYTGKENAFTICKNLPFSALLNTADTEEARRSNREMEAQLAAMTPQQRGDFLIEKLNDLPYGKLTPQQALQMSDADLVKNFRQIHANAQLIDQIDLFLEKPNMVTFTEQQKGQLEEMKQVKKSMDYLTARMDAIANPFYKHLRGDKLENIDDAGLKKVIDQLNLHLQNDNNKVSQYVEAILDLRGQRRELEKELPKELLEELHKAQDKAVVKEQPKEQVKVEVKEQPKAEVKEQPKQQPKEQPKAQPNKRSPAQILESLHQRIKAANKGFFIGSSEFRSMNKAFQKLRSHFVDVTGNISTQQREEMRGFLNGARDASAAYLRKKNIDPENLPVEYGKNAREKARIDAALLVYKFANKLTAVNDMEKQAAPQQPKAKAGASSQWSNLSPNAFYETLQMQVIKGEEAMNQLQSGQPKEAGALNKAVLTKLQGDAAQSFLYRATEASNLESFLQIHRLEYANMMNNLKQYVADNAQAVQADPVAFANKGMEQFNRQMQENQPKLGLVDQPSKNLEDPQPEPKDNEMSFHLFN